MTEESRESGTWPMQELPTGWSWASFGSVFNNVTDNERKLKQKEYLKAGKLPVIDQGAELIGGYTDDESLAHGGHPPFIVFGDHTRCIKLVPFQFVQGADGVKVLQPRLIDHKYAYYMLKAICLPSRGYSRHYRLLRSSRFPVPPLNEQRRIVAKIEELFSGLDAGVAALERARANLKRYRASVLKAAVDGSLTADSRPSLYKWRKLSELVTHLEQGWSPKCSRTGSEDPAAWVVMKTSAIQPLTFVEVENKLLPDSLSPRPELELRVGDLLITRAGPRNRAGVTCLVRQTRPRVILCDKAYRIRFDVTLVAPGFVEIVLNSPTMLDRLNQLKTGISDSGVNLTQKRFLELTIPVPPLSVQRSVEQEVLSRLSVIDAADRECTRSLALSARLRQSILKQAFEGKLVPQDPNDEPASVLLDRLRGSASQEANGKQATKPPRKRAKTDIPASQ